MHLLAILVPLTVGCADDPSEQTKFVQTSRTYFLTDSSGIPLRQTCFVDGGNATTAKVGEPLRVQLRAASSTASCECPSKDGCGHPVCDSSEVCEPMGVAPLTILSAKLAAGEMLQNGAVHPRSDCTATINITPEAAAPVDVELTCLEPGVVLPVFTVSTNEGQPISGDVARIWFSPDGVCPPGHGTSTVLDPPPDASTADGDRGA